MIAFDFSNDSSVLLSFSMLNAVFTLVSKDLSASDDAVVVCSNEMRFSAALSLSFSSD